MESIADPVSAGRHPAQRFKSKKRCRRIKLTSTAPAALAMLYRSCGKRGKTAALVDLGSARMWANHHRGIGGTGRYLDNPKTLAGDVRSHFNMMHPQILKLP